MAISSLGVQEVSTTSGTGPYALLASTPDHWRFQDKLFEGDVVTYEANDGARSEYGRGRFEYPATLHRLAIINSSEADQPVDWPVSGQCIISLVSDPNGALPPGGDCAQALIKYSDADYAASWQWRPYPIAIWIEGRPGANRSVRLAITEWVRFFGGFGGSVAYADTAAASNIVIEINRLAYTGETILLGTVTFASGSLVGYWVSTGGAEQQLLATDRIEFLFPASSGTLADISITVRGIIVCGGTLPPLPVLPPEPPSDPLWDNVVLLCHYDGVDGSAIIDSSPFHHSFTTITGQAITTAQARFGPSSLQCGLSGFSYNNTGDSGAWWFDDGPFTVEMWIRPTVGLITLTVLVCQHGNTGLDRGWALWFDGAGHLQFSYSTTGTDYPAVSGSYVPTLNQWVHIAADRDASGVLRVYADGVVVASATVTAAFWDSHYGLFVGGDLNSGRQFIGQIDDLRITKGIARYGGAFDPPTEPFPDM